jgi:hypothetical protein
MMAGKVSQALEDYAAACDAADIYSSQHIVGREALDIFAWPTWLPTTDSSHEASLNHSKQALLWAETAKSRASLLRRLRLSGMTRSHGVSRS